MAWGQSLLIAKERECTLLLFIRVRVRAFAFTGWCDYSKSCEELDFYLSLRCAFGLYRITTIFFNSEKLPAWRR